MEAKEKRAGTAELLDVEARTEILSLLLDVEAVATLLAVSTRSVRRGADSGKIPRPIKVLSLVRWRLRTGDPMTGILDWIEAGCPNCRQTRRAGR